MKLTTDALPTRLKGELAPLYVLFGDEPLLILEAADAIRARAREQGFSERVVLTVDAAKGYDWNQLFEHNAAMSLFATRRLLEVAIPGGKPGVEGGEALTRLAGALNADTLVLVILPELDWRSQQGDWFAALERAGMAVEAKAVSRDALPAWLAERLKRAGLAADDDALEWLADRVEGNLLAARQEVDKLALLHPDARLTLADVEDAVIEVARFDIDDLAEAITQGKPERVARIVAGLEAEGEGAPLVLWVIANTLRNALAIAESGRALQGMPRARAASVERYARRAGADKLAALLGDAHQVDRATKGLDAQDGWVALSRLATAAARSAA